MRMTYGYGRSDNLIYYEGGVPTGAVGISGGERESNAKNKPIVAIEILRFAQDDSLALLAVDYINEPKLCQ